MGGRACGRSAWACEQRHVVPPGRLRAALSAVPRWQQWRLCLAHACAPSPHLGIPQRPAPTRSMLPHAPHGGH